jgi:hypothetical protein
MTNSKEVRMETQSSRMLDRFGAVSGVAAVLLLLALFMVFPALPAPDDPISTIARSATDDAGALLRGAYVGSLMTGALVLFGAALAARLRRAEGPAGGWWIVALAGIAGTTMGIVADALVVTFVRAVGHGAAGASLWIGYGADHWIGTLLAVPLAIFLLGAGFGTRASGALPRWLGWLAIVLAAGFVLGAGSVTGDEVDGGVLGVVLFFAYIGLLVWIVGASVSMLRRPVGRSVSVETAATEALA